MPGTRARTEGSPMVTLGRTSQIAESDKRRWRPQSLPSVDSTLWDSHLAFIGPHLVLVCFSFDTHLELVDSCLTLTRGLLVCHQLHSTTLNMDAAFIWTAFIVWTVHSRMQTVWPCLLRMVQPHSVMTQITSQASLPKRILITSRRGCLTALKHRIRRRALWETV